MPIPFLFAQSPGGFLPPQLDNLAAWFRFNQGITESSGAVSQWADASGNGRHLKQATGAAQPALQGDGSILFDGSSDVLKTDAFTLNQPETIYLLFRQVTWTAADHIFDGVTNDLGTLNQPTAAGTPNLGLFAGASVTANPNLALNTYGAVASVINGASSSILVNATTETTGDAGASNMGGFTLGARGDGGLNFANIQVKEAIVYAAAHSAATRAAVIAYLARIGGL
jgi:hypothetical protein